jgi:hypothetical protein
MWNLLTHRPHTTVRKRNLRPNTDHRNFGVNTEESGSSIPKKDDEGQLKPKPKLRNTVPELQHARPELKHTHPSSKLNAGDIYGAQQLMYDMYSRID